MRVPPPSSQGFAPQGQSAALLGRRRPTLEKPGWRSAMMCVGILILTIIAVAFMFVVVRTEQQREREQQKARDCVFLVVS